MGCATPPPPPPPLEDLKDASKQIVNLLTLGCYGVFSFLIGLDVWRAYNKRAIWLPGNAFALTGVTVQIIVWWTSLKKQNFSDGIIGLIFGHQLVISGRVAVCVFIGYLMPVMSAPSVRTFVALAIIVFAQIASELMLLFKTEYPYLDSPELLPSNWSKNWSTIADLVVFISIILLGLILGCTTLARKTIHDLLSQRVSAISPIIEEDEFQFSNERTNSISWNDFEDEVLRSWFVARICRVDYVICRSGFSSAVGIIVTTCVIVCLLSNTLYNEYFDISDYPPDICTILLLIGFIVIGWVVICWRWLGVQLYFGPHRHNWRKSLHVEHLWTSNIVDLIHMYGLKRDRQRFQRSFSKMPWLSKLQSLRIIVFTKIRLHKLLYLVLMLQNSVVFFSKVCGFLSEVTVGRFVYWCRKYMRKGDRVESARKYASILECLCMPGENPSDLWEANHKSFKKAKLLMENGCEEGTSSKEINSIFCLYSMQWAEDGMVLLNKLRKFAVPSVLKHFPSVEKQCVKITVVSLITIFIQLHKAKSDHFTKIVKACGEVWELLTFVEECDIDLQATEIVLLDDLNRDKDQVCMAADREFYKLQIEYIKLSGVGCEGAQRFLEHLLSDCEGFLRRENLLGDCKEEIAVDLRDSKDWMKIARSYTLYKLCKLMLDEDIEDFVEWTNESLRNIIAYSMSRLPDMLIKQCWKWAQEFEEDKLWEALHLKGKCKGMMEAWNLKPILSTRKEWGIEEMMSTEFLPDL